MEQQIDVSQLSEKDRAELQQFITNESRKAQIQGMVHQLTDTCFRKCVGSIKSGKLDKSEESCTQNCVDRFLDGNMVIVKALEAMNQRR